MVGDRCFAFEKADEKVGLWIGLIYMPFWWAST